MTQRVMVVCDSDELDGQIVDLKAELNGSLNLNLIKKSDIPQHSLNLKPDFVLVDSSFIQSEGRRGIRKLTREQFSENIPLILLTNDPEKDKLHRLFEVGITDFILKPLKAKELVYRLKTTAISNVPQDYKLDTHPQSHESLPNVEVDTESSVNAVISLYPDGKIDWVNEGFEKIYECSFEDYLEQYDHFIFDENGEGFNWALNKFKEGEKGLTFEHQVQTISSGMKWIQTTLTPLYDESGELNKIMAVETDITKLYLEKKKTEELLANIFPHEISEQLKRKGKAKSKKYRMVTVLFADFENFTTLTKTMGVDELITELNRYVRKFDEIIERHYLEKIKTMGDAYMCAGGLPLKNFSNPIDVTLASLEIQKFVSEMASEKIDWGERPWKLRIGVHTGKVMAGVIGTKKFAYDIWGNTVNIASRMEETSDVGRVNVSGTTYEYIQDYFEFTYRGKIKMKNVTEEIDMYYVNRLKPEYSEDEEGIIPNAQFRKLLAKF